MNKKAMMVVVGMLAYSEGLEDVTNDLAAIAVQMFGSDTQAIEAISCLMDAVDEAGEQGIRELTKEVFRENLLLLVDSIS